ncbi:protein tyrosine kinase [Rhodoblastus sphagnicola]|uniref:non-specific protein-tyrosine kinase n=2 Tax=Rhodoblastus sphagnicola TaxID=333368 RepID=A0A2S6N9M0_9HYPH|nr:AAA family ATPase [Rhodoblastus sphagnicola]PPQ31287.1 protein tyrosine kinase [Rhodoblastus sphagnicola]
MERRRMLQSDLPRAARLQPADAAGEGGIGEIVNFVLGLLRRQYKLMLASVAIALTLAGAYLWFTPPTYTAQAQILLKNSKAQFVKEEFVLADPVLTPTEIETQIQVLKSSAIAIAVIKELNLAADPDFVGAESALASHLRTLLKYFSPPDPAKTEAGATESTEFLIGAFDGRVDAHRAGFSNILEVSFSSSSPSRAAEIANAVAAAYINDQLNSKLEANHRAIAWLQDRLRELGEQAGAAEQAVDAYKMQHKIVSSGGKSIDEQQIAEFNARLMEARAQTADKLARLNQYESVSLSNAENLDSLGVAASDALANPIINTLRSQYLELQRRESEWVPRYGETHAAISELRIQMRNIRKSINDEVRRLAETSRSDYELAKKRQQELEKQLNNVVSTTHVNSPAEITLRKMESDAKTYRSLYETFQQRYMAAVQQESFPILEARVVDPALPPASKSKPKSKLILLVGAFGGLALGAAIGLLRDMMDRTFRTPAQVETCLRLPCFSVVPRMPAHATSGPREEAAESDSHPTRAVPTPHSVDSIVVGMPMSRFAEAIRYAKIGIDLNPSKSLNKIIGITSSLPDEGKTTIAASLARLIAHSGQRVIIVDCDLKRPSLSARLSPNAACGLVEVVTGRTPLEQAIWRDPKTNFAFLPVVRRAPLFHTSELLASEATRRLFERLRASYDFVIVDMPPLIPLVDARATASFTDCHLLVIEWGRTKIEVVKQALHSAPNVYENIVGAVLNKADTELMADYDQNCRDYYDIRHYTRYHSDDSFGEV